MWQKSRCELLFNTSCSGLLCPPPPATLPGSAHWRPARLQLVEKSPKSPPPEPLVTSERRLLKSSPFFKSSARQNCFFT